MCPPVDILIVLATSKNQKWRLIHIDVETAFLQPGPAEILFFMIPPHKSKYSNEYQLLLAGL